MVAPAAAGAGSGARSSVPVRPAGAPARSTPNAVGAPPIRSAVTRRAASPAAGRGEFGHSRSTTSWTGVSGVKVRCSRPLTVRPSLARSNASVTTGRCGSEAAYDAGHALTGDGDADGDGDAAVAGGWLDAAGAALGEVADGARGATGDGDAALAPPPESPEQAAS